MGGGAVLDIGIYTLQLQQLVFKGLKPISIESSGYLNQSGVEDSAFIIIKYPEGKHAVLGMSTKTLFPNEALIVGKHGLVKVATFWCVFF